MIENPGGIIMFWKRKEQERIEGIAWFSYTIMLPEEDEEEITAIGNFIFKNIGNSILHNPYICLRIKPPQVVQLGGKIGALSHTALSIDGTNAEAWHYIHDNWKDTVMDHGEHWLKPHHSNQIEPNNQLTFSNEIRITSNQKDKFVSIDGFAYCDEVQSGFASLNNLLINF